MDYINSVDALDEFYRLKLKEIQEKCKHVETTWAMECWAPAHGTGFEVKICNKCNKELDRREQK